MDNDNLGIRGDMPIGLGLMLSANNKAMNNFANMTDEEKRSVIEVSRTKQTKGEMESFVNDLSNNFR